MEKMHENCSLVPRLHPQAFYRTVYKKLGAFIHGAIKSLGVESGNEAMKTAYFIHESMKTRMFLFSPFSAYFPPLHHSGKWSIM